jgi:hypothetical protein
VDLEQAFLQSWLMIQVLCNSDDSILHAWHITPSSPEDEHVRVYGIADGLHTFFYVVVVAPLGADDSRRLYFSRPL